MAYAVVTGASSGIGRDIAKELSKRGYDLILAARREDKLKELSAMLDTDAKIFGLDLSKEAACRELYENCRDLDVEILVNNAGFGCFGDFCEIPLETELNMVDLNVKAVHILTKLFLQDFQKKNSGKILNVASIAGFMPSGALLSTYYATKAYVVSLTESIAREQKGSGVSVSVLCPGPVNTEFNDVAGVEFAKKGISSEKAAKIAVDGMFKGKTVIIPGITMKLGRFGVRFLPDKLWAELVYKFQKSKGENT